MNAGTVTESKGDVVTLPQWLIAQAPVVGAWLAYVVEEVLKYKATIDGEYGCCHSPAQIAAGECDTGDPFEALQWLAYPLADRPGWRPEWRPAMTAAQQDAVSEEVRG
jgi:hypothetical protein